MNHQTRRICQYCKRQVIEKTQIIIKWVWKWTKKMNEWECGNRNKKCSEQAWKAKCHTCLAHICSCLCLRVIVLNALKNIIMECSVCNNWLFGSNRFQWKVICAGVLKTNIILHAHAYLNFSGVHNLLNITTALSVALNILIWHLVFFFILFVVFFIVLSMLLLMSPSVYNCFRTVCSHWTFTFASHSQLQSSVDSGFSLPMQHYFVYIS